MRSMPLLLSALLLAACTTTGPRPVPGAPGTTTPPPGDSLEVWTGEVPLPQPPRIRVGLGSDERDLTFPRIEGGYVLIEGNGAPRHTRRGFTLTAPRPESAVEYGVQLASLADLASAEALAQKVEASGRPSLIVQDAASGLRRIYAGRFADRTAAMHLRETLLDEGYPSDILVARLPSTVEFDPVIRLRDDEGIERVMRTRSLLIAPASAETIPILGHRYRGAAIAHVNDRGLLNGINVLNLEHYVRGVVPNELGPSVYAQVEALKAQAMAARTYAVKRLGDFEQEGYDICPTAACQVYEGFETEHPLSNQAVDETAGMIMTYQGEPIDALYTSTCGGETSDVSTMFPSRNEPYLAHVRCVENDFLELAGRRDSGPLTDAELRASIFRAFAGLPDDEPWSAAAAERSVSAAARVAGFTPASGLSLGSTRRGATLEYLGRALRLDEMQQTLILPEDREYFFQGTSGSAAARTAAFINKYRLGPAQILDPAALEETMSRESLQAILYGWLEQQDAIRSARGTIASMQGSQLALIIDGKATTYPVPDETRIYKSISDQTREQEIVQVLISDRARVLRDRQGVVKAIVVEANYDGAAFDRTSSYSSWIRTYSAAELTELIRKRQPVEPVSEITVLSRDEAGRIEAVEVVSTTGTRTRIAGIPVRWSLGVPDNLFSHIRTVGPDGTPRFTFWGKGWGHGTGLCQVGAYGMALRGHDARDIVTHYYTGIEISRVAVE